MRIGIAGAGYVGLSTGVAFASMGHDVTVVDIDRAKIDRLAAGHAPFYEPELDELLSRALQKRTIRFTDRLAQTAREVDLVFIAVGTPAKEDGEADLSALWAVAGALGRSGAAPKTAVIKSTVPVGTGDLVEERLRSLSRAPWRVVSNPEFLREGSALRDFFHPDRIIVGASPPEAAAGLRQLYSGIDAPFLVMPRRAAEMVKYASNAFLAAKISFINQIGDLCERTGVDVTQVSLAMGLDARIGEAFLRAGLGWGGSCFPKDTAALIRQFEQQGIEPSILRAVSDVNRSRRRRFLELARSCLGGFRSARIALWGASFKPGTDDLREAPSLEIIERLLQEGAEVRVCDPAAGEKIAAAFDVETAADPLAAADGADAVLLATEWDLFLQVDLAELKARMRRPLLIDGRNAFDPGRVRRHGIAYAALGRPGP